MKFSWHVTLKEERPGTAGCDANPSTKMCLGIFITGIQIDISYLIEKSKPENKYKKNQIE